MFGMDVLATVDPIGLDFPISVELGMVGFKASTLGPQNLAKIGVFRPSKF